MSSPRPRPRVVREPTVDWVKFDACLARDGSVDPVDKALYAALASFVDPVERDQEDTDPDGFDVPTRKRLAECIGRSVDTVDRATKRLEARGLLEVERRRDPDNPRRHIPSLYRLLDVELWDDRAAARAERRRAEREARRSENRGGRTSAARGSRMDAARGSRTGAAVPYREGKKKEDPPPTPSGTRASADTPARQEEEFVDNAKQLVASALRFWDSSHARPSAPTRRKLVSRVAQELAAGADPDAVFAELVRDLHPSQARSAVRVVMARTREPGWAQGGENPARLMANVRPPWCGTCDEATRHLVEVLADGRDQVIRCPYCHPVAVAEHTTITETTETPTATPAHQEPQTAAERTQSAEEPERGPRGEREPFDPATKPEAPGVCGVHRTTLTADAQCLVCLSEVEAEQAAYGPQANVDSPEPPTGPVDPAAGSDGDSEDPDEIRALIEQSLNSASPRGADHGGRKGRGWTPPPVIAELRERLAKIQERSA